MLPSRFAGAKLIGNGGFASVYAVQDPKLGSIAVKLPKDPSPDELSRFSREVELQSELAHPNIVEVLDFELNDSPPWYSMSKADGNLAQAAESNEWDDLTILGLFFDVLSGVGHAHGEHILHRDLKPGNVLVYGDPGGPVARVSDFGLGRRFTRDRMNFQTATAYAAGSDFYTAPEQWQDFREVTESADVFSLGRILDSLLRARPNVARANPQLLDCVRVATRTDPLERYQSVEQLAVAVGLATTDPVTRISVEENLLASMQEVDDSPTDSLAVDRLIDAVEKLGQDPGSLITGLTRLSDAGLRALCVKHPGRLRSLISGAVNDEHPLAVHAALRVLHFLENSLEFAADPELRGIAMFSIVRLASVYQMEEFVGPARHHLYTEDDAAVLGVLQSLLAKDKFVLNWLRSNSDSTKIRLNVGGV